MSARTSRHDDRAIRVAAVLDDWLAGLDRGEAADADAVIARHPDLAPDLGDALASLGLLRRATSGARDAGMPAPDGVLGEFRILREIGRGGMGVVYEAEQVSLGRRVALKVLPLAAVLDPRHLRRFQQEAQAAAHLHHPNIVAVHSVGCDRGVHFYAMQFVEGSSLAQAIRERRAAGTPMDPREAAGLALQAAEALHYAHENGVVHRDVKPGNLLVDGRGHLWVADFGLARMPADVSLTASGDLVGTMRYMSPEQARRQPADARSDVYALGATLYELLALEPALPGDEPGRLLRDLLEADPVPLRRRNPAVPVDLETVVSKAMAREPAARYPAAHDLAEDLRRFLAGRPVAARRPGWGQRIGAWTRRHRGLVASAAVVLVLTSAALGWGLLRAEDALGVAATERTDARQALARARVNGLLNASEVASRTDPVLGLLLAREASRLSREAGVLRALRGALLSCLERVRCVGHEGGLYDARFLPDGGLLTASASDGTLRRWDRRGRLLSTGRCYPAVARLAPAGDRLYVWSEPPPEGSPDGIWSPEGTRLASLPEAGTGRALAAEFSPDGTRLLVGQADGVARLWTGDFASPPRVVTLGVGIDRLAFAPDGSRFLTGSSAAGEILLWEVDGAVPVRVTGHEGGIAGLAFARDGATFVTVSTSGVLTRWDLAGRQVSSVRTFPGEDVAVGRRVGGGRRFLVGTTAGPAWSWDLDTGDWVRLPGHASRVTAVDASADGAVLATASQDRTVRVWGADGRTLAVLRGHEAAVTSVAFSDDATAILTASEDGTARLWDLRPSEPVRLGDGPLAVAAVGPGGVVAGGMPGDGTLLLFAPDGARVARREGHEAPLSDVSFSWDGGRIATGARDGSARLWTGTGEPVAALAAHGSGALSVSFAARASTLLTLGGDRIARLWRADGSAADAIEEEPKVVRFATISADGNEVLWAGPDDVVRLHRVGGPSRDVLRGAAGSLSLVAWSPDGQRLLAWASDPRDPTVGVWRLDGTPAGRLAGHGGRIVSARWSPRGDRVLTAAEDGTVRVWSPDGVLGAQIRLPQPVRHAIFDPSGERIAIATEDGAVRTFTSAGRPLDELPHPGLDLSEIAFTPEGDRILTVARDAPAFLWTTDVERLLRLADERVVRELTHAERVRYRDLLGPENELRIRAHETVTAAFEDLVLQDEVMERIRGDASMSSEERAVALELASERRDDPQGWNRRAWTVVQGPGVDPRLLTWALRLADAAHRKLPEDAYILNTLAIAQLRLGRHAEALENLLECDRVNSASTRGPLVEDVAGIALALEALGRHEEAIAARDRLRRLLLTPRYVNDVGRRRWLQEVEAAVGTE